MGEHWSRELESGQMRFEVYDEMEVGADPVVWLQGKAQEGMNLLAHADDGVIWGYVKNKTLQFPPVDLFQQASWRRETLQMARLFDAKQEILLWRTGENTWRARCLKDSEGEPSEYFDEEQVLWGTEAEASNGGFTRMTEGEQGLYHAPPLELSRHRWENGQHPLRLKVRHYLAEDNDGWVRIANSRLTGLSSEKEKLP